MMYLYTKMSAKAIATKMSHLYLSNSSFKAAGTSVDVELISLKVVEFSESSFSVVDTPGWGVV